jgi:hypothetical protein
MYVLLGKTSFEEILKLTKMKCFSVKFRQSRPNSSKEMPGNNKSKRLTRRERMEIYGPGSNLSG